MRGPGFSYLAGVRVAGASIWCDAARARAVCFLSRADVAGFDRRGRGRPERLIATERTIALLRALGAPAVDALVPRYGRPFAIGRARLELVPSGALPGGAQLLIELGGWRGLYAGTPSPRALPGAEPLQARACDELVVDAPEEGGVADGLDAAPSGEAGLAPQDLRALFALRDRLPDRLAAGARLARALGDKPARRDRAAPTVSVIAGRRDPDDAVLALGLGPTVEEIAAFAGECGARRVFVRLYGREPRRVAGARALATALRARSIEAVPLGPPEQLSLFSP